MCDTVVTTVLMPFWPEGLSEGSRSNFRLYDEAVSSCCFVCSLSFFISSFLERRRHCLSFSSQLTFREDAVIPPSLLFFAVAADWRKDIVSFCHSCWWRHLLRGLERGVDKRRKNVCEKKKKTLEEDRERGRDVKNITIWSVHKKGRLTFCQNVSAS